MNDKEKSAERKGRKTIDLVTGATSPLGVALTKKLIEQGDEVRVLVHQNPSKSDTWKKLPPGVIPFVGDISLSHESDATALAEACKGVNNVFHIASAVYRYKHKTSEDYLNVNVVGTENVLRACVDNNASGTKIRFIVPTTDQVYGTKRPGEVLTESSETRPHRIYGESKLMQEQVIKSFASVHKNIQYTIFRTTLIYGVEFMVPFFAKIFRYIKEQKMRYIGTGNNHITMIHISDVVNAMAIASASQKAVNQVYNLSDGTPYTVRMLFEKAAKFMGVEPPKKKVSPALARILAKAIGLDDDEYNLMVTERIVSNEKLKRDIMTPKAKVDDKGKEMVDEFLKRYKH